MLETLYIASKNLHKVEEFAKLLRPLPVRVLPLPHHLPDSPEGGSTFEANAAEKASFYAPFCDGWVLADDSGLCVDALDGAPGVRSARYAGVHGDDAANNAKLLAEMAGIPDPDRTARFVCVLALYHWRRQIGWLVRGEAVGRILDKSAGVGGFGYDPLFYVPEMGRTFAELSAEEKLRVSHRGRAVDKLIEVWRGADDTAVHRER
ncbi:hypothetical protein GCM10025857_36830 [Alicyclobacillus contaminans]|uniref:RdgB/HAM1 family non-canonical purine NTP pyrophosphatase n=1 Tax=Alicyclobacillus contaminans TaxID=392016 RepID=UPI000412D6EE|nr:RdgB/HAM1 family non-canonical purine NTP pyrophosphatase [Alicyclobacillus contaminans]GMA52326.1 hypothetical protein GCM10025857_36830 [Alicyclobacillus contaminans]